MKLVNWNRTISVWLASAILVLAPLSGYAQNPVVVGGKAILGGKASVGGGSGVTTVTCGLTTAGSNTDGGNADIPFATPCVTGSDPSGYTVQSCSYYAVATSNAGRCGVYTDSSGNPNTLLCQSATISSPSVGFNVLSLSGCGTLTNGITYWIGFITSDSANAEKYNTGSCPGYGGGSKYGTTQGSATLPASFGSNTNIGNCYSAYMTLVPN